VLDSFTSAESLHQRGSIECELDQPTFRLPLFLLDLHGILFPGALAQAGSPMHPDGVEQSAGGNETQEKKSPDTTKSSKASSKTLLRFKTTVSCRGSLQSGIWCRAAHSDFSATGIARLDLHIHPEWPVDASPRHNQLHRRRSPLRDQPPSGAGFGDEF